MFCLIVHTDIAVDYCDWLATYIATYINSKMYGLIKHANTTIIRVINTHAVSYQLQRPCSYDVYVPIYVRNTLLFIFHM